MVEIYDYSRGYISGYTLSDDERANKGRKKDYKSSDYDENREKVLNRARTRLRRIINSNVNQYGKEFTSKFVTLTFKENVTDLKQANYEFKKFIKRLNYHMFGVKESNIRYSAVPEFQKRGAVHYHIVFYNLPYLKSDDVATIWGNGFIKINKIEHVDNVGAYVCKYMGKENSDERLQGNKSYFNSKGLYQPSEFTDGKDKKIVESLRNSLLCQNIKYVGNFDNEYLGDIDYYQFNLNYINESLKSVVGNMSFSEYKESIINTKVD